MCANDKIKRLEGLSCRWFNEAYCKRTIRSCAISAFYFQYTSYRSGVGSSIGLVGEKKKKTSHWVRLTGSFTLDRVYAAYHVGKRNILLSLRCFWFSFFFLLRALSLHTLERAAVGKKFETMTSGYFSSSLDITGNKDRHRKKKIVAARSRYTREWPVRS